MKKEWLWGPGRIAPDYENLTKQEYLKKLGDVRERYLNKLLDKLTKDDISYICRLEKGRFLILAEWDRLSEEEFSRILSTNDSDRLKSIANIAAHLLTHEEKNIDPEINEPLKHMAEHEEAHLRQVQRLVKKFRLGEERRTS